MMVQFKSYPTSFQCPHPKVARVDLSTPAWESYVPHAVHAENSTQFTVCVKSSRGKVFEPWCWAGGCSASIAAVCILAPHGPTGIWPDPGNVSYLFDLH